MQFSEEESRLMEDIQETIKDKVPSKFLIWSNRRTVFFYKNMGVCHIHGAHFLNECSRS